MPGPDLFYFWHDPTRTDVFYFGQTRSISGRGVLFRAEVFYFGLTCSISGRTSVMLPSRAANRRSASGLSSHIADQHNDSPLNSRTSGHSAERRGEAALGYAHPEHVDAWVVEWWTG
eukprot:1933336-Rhodomonas_salina.2